MSLDNELRASIAAQMLLPKEEGHSQDAVRRVASHLLEIRTRAERDAVQAHNEDRSHEQD